MRAPPAPSQHSRQRRARRRDRCAWAGQVVLSQKSIRVRFQPCAARDCGVHYGSPSRRSASVPHSAGREMDRPPAGRSHRVPTRREARAARSSRAQATPLRDAERRLLAQKGKPLGRKLLAEMASLATPETILRWYREQVTAKYDGSRTRGSSGLHNHPRRQGEAAADDGAGESILGLHAASGFRGGAGVDVRRYWKGRPSESFRWPSVRRDSRAAVRFALPMEAHGGESRVGRDPCALGTSGERRGQARPQRHRPRVRRATGTGAFVHRALRRVDVARAWHHHDRPRR